MAVYDLIMPKMGESIAEATIIRWLKEEGDKIEVDEPVLEIATDKVDSEVPSPEAGILSKQLFKEGDIVEVGQAVAKIETEGSASNDMAPPEVDEVSKKTEELPPVTQPSARVEVTAEPKKTAPAGDRFYSPLVLNIARTEGVPMDELEKVPGSGKEGRVTKRDILSYIKDRSAQPAEARSTPAEKQPATAEPAKVIKEAPPVSVNQGDEIIEMDRMRKLISDHMIMSKHTSAHVTSFVEADVTNLVAWRNKVKKDYQSREGENITFTPLFIQAVVKAIKDFPMINISVDGDKIIKRRDINIGMAAALPSGNLIVPVIKNADTKNLIGLTREVNDLARRARENKLKPDEIQGGTYTITNVGTFGNVMGTPVINQPQVAILATGAIRKKPAVIETELGDLIGIRQMMYLSHSYDHRVVDGALGGQFVRRVADYLEQWDVNLEI